MNAMVEIPGILFAPSMMIKREKRIRQLVLFFIQVICSTRRKMISGRLIDLLGAWAISIIGPVVNPKAYFVHSD